MSAIEYIALILNLLICLPSVASMTKFDYWWVRVFDFPRIQIAVLIVLNIILGLYAYSFSHWSQYAILILLGIGLVYQCWLILPYTILWPKQVIKYGGTENKNIISILVSNVLTTNSEYHRLIDLIKLKDPDVFLTLESDHKWEKALSVLEESYTYTVKIPLDNLYGMHLYSKLPLEETEVKYLIKDHIPSIHGKIKLANGKSANFHCLHPRPPSPTESKTSTNRDAELLLVGKNIEEDAKLVLVFGDLNDVAWSRTTKMFQKISGLMDPRRGRGFFNTFTTRNILMRWPLDHVFHSNDFTLIEMSRERDIGSDHFPMYIKLNYTPEAEWEQDELNASQSDREWADKKIEKGEKNEKND
ncbi:endonuclease/exonuclease/phosphatase (EEP) superfamily protein YafD [Gelidibacter algens]|uniref:Endonuclease/exonuclease/phosphatase (EEP) superfamily protein YafD n=1 Tax=Gelidibacter algens TaxID=49280 RepID=A0A1A7R3N1_9FLAO|nr:endonuclease/exonuclease/phosphatase family protein [Gelidibacter algens]OBX25382.1 endonuclease [Gelidibacter algens]RAJ24724.1 endonuclease/exonuclease/phosphatase (EEP) superfamily protein YafD [Gelidibacter algens]